MLRLNNIRFASFAPVSLALISLGCAVSSADDVGEETVADTDSPIVSADTPYVQYSVTGNPPSLGVHGRFLQSSPSSLAPTSYGEYSNDSDLGGVSTNVGTWQTSCHTLNITSNNFDNRLANAVEAAEAGTAGVLQSPDTILDAWKQIGAHISDSGEQAAFHGYDPIRARWLRSQYAAGSGTWSPEVNYQYDEPDEMADIRQRGARLYCSARETIERQGAKRTMGNLAAFSLNIGSKRIDFLNVEPTARIAGAQRFTNGATNDGAQAFTIPMHMGTIITPVKGLGLPALSETLFPVALVTADSEVGGRTNRRQVFTGYSYVPGQGLKANYATKYSKEYLTAGHADGVRSIGQSMHADKEFPLFYVGPVKFSMNFGMDMSVGRVSSDTDSVLAYGADPRRESSGTHLGLTYNDGPWDRTLLPGIRPVYNGFKVLPEGTNQSYWRGTFDQLGPMAIRAYQNDDHVLDAKTSTALTATIKGTLGGSFGGASVTVTASGSVTGTVTQHHMIRDALFAEGNGGTRMTGSTGLTIRPRTTADVTLSPLTAVLHISISYGFGHLNWDATLLQVDPITLADYDSDENNAWPESTHLRIGTGSESGDPMMQPNVRSHVLNGSNFSAFPESVDACLAEPSIEPVEPEVCQSQPTDNGAAPQLNMCAYATITSPPGIGPSFPPTNVCGAQATWAARMAPVPGLKTCAERLLSDLCAHVSYEEVLSQNSSYVSHVANDNAQLASIIKTLQDCGNTAHGLGMSSTQIEDWFESLVGFSACDSQGRLMDNDDLISGAADPTQAPSANAGRVCP